MREVMDEKRPGPTKSNEDNALSDFICAYIRHCGPKQSDDKIAQRFYESDPYYIIFPSGVTVVATKEFQAAADMTLAENPKAVTKPIAKTLGALERKVHRVRQWAIEEGVLPKEYSPRPWRH
jgi:hypothetical protein